MRRRERSEDQPKGGLVADQMGLGSTFIFRKYFLLSVDDDFHRNNTDVG